MKRKKEAGYGVRLGESYGIQLGQKKISKNSDFWQTLFISMLLLTIMLGANTGALGFVLGGKLKLEIVFAPVVFFLLIYGVLIWKIHFGKWLAGVFLISCALWATFRWQECRAAIDWLLNRFTVLSNQYYNVEQGMITLPEGYSEEYLKNMTGFLWNLALGWAVLEMNRNRMHFWGPAVAVSFTPVILLNRCCFKEGAAAGVTCNRWYSVCAYDCRTFSGTVLQTNSRGQYFKKRME